ncbi:transglutaminase [Defluviimonas sp. 20V17]|uniref:Transglutaminase n=1 Tax=Allgaiera indica TaxID=765699 RepID=A0AAN4ZYT0_9RHOB|nr:transglutaminase family protein [Allgaiera indica]KDB03321.1 transglutaminase [Defluviimonas sp. 20V17]GHE00416.1 transglutaminase [Allgaiera indica]SDW62272.1 Transglutaminase-like enzyme, putative cysteine protease [Allgaiera indica]
MRYDITLRVDYAYDFASDQARNLLHLLPRVVPGRQGVVASLLTVDPAPQERWDGLDFFGNGATWIAYHEPIDSISLSLKAQTVQTTPAMGMDLSPRLAGLEAEIGACQDLGPEAPHHFLGRSARVAPDPEMTAFARDHAGAGQSALQAVQAVGGALHREMAFDAAATDARTPTAEAFAQRRGVCQDFSHVMIACLRGLGIPAGYVSGFLRTLPPPGQPRLEGADAMHAWVRAWCGSDMGWVEFDPTNDTFVRDDHIVVSYGRDYADVAPVRGTLRSTGGQHTEHAVDVVPLDPA